MLKNWCDIMTEKMKIVGFCKFFNDEDNLDRCLKQMSKVCDDIVVCDDSSTDGSRMVAERYTKHIITLEDDFKAELIHKKALLEKALELKPDFILSLDSDEVIDKPEELKDLCERMIKEESDGAYMHLRNLWKSEDEYRVDNAFNSLFKCNLWRNNGKLEFGAVEGLHQAQHPIGISKCIYSNIQIIHYGFSSEAEIKKKYETYKKYGQTGWALERINPFSNSTVRKVGSHVEKPKVTVAVPIFNTKPEYFIQCLNSISQQTYTDYEILVYDDGSDSEKVENIINICKVMDAGYCGCDVNKGIGYARNFLIDSSYAKGDYIMFISADDFLLPNALDILMKEPKDDVFYYSNMIIVNEQGAKVQDVILPSFANNEDFTMAVISSARESRMFTNYNMFSSTKNWKNHLFDESYKTGEDLEHLLRHLLVNKAKFEHVNHQLFVCRTHSEAWSAKLGMEEIIKKNQKTFKKINELLEFELF